MFKDEQLTGRTGLERQIEQKFAELAQLVSQREFGEDGPPRELSFREIEDVGYRVGQMAAAAFEVAAAKDHQHHFKGDQPCPQCGKACRPLGESERCLLTRLGPLDLSELEFHCDACRRSFFPSA